MRQYLKNIGGEVEVVTLSGEKKKGILKSVDSAGFELEIVSKEKVDGKKVEVTKSLTYSFDQIKTVKIIISFN